MATTDPATDAERATRTVEYRWDDDYRLVGVTASDAELGERVTTIRRDAGGRVLESIDPTGVTTRFEWDSRGLMASATDPAGGVTSYDYDRRGRLSGMLTPGGARTTVGYGLDGRQDSVTDPAGVLTTLLREANGFVVGARHADGSGWDRRLDAMGREIERVGTDGTVAGRFGYDTAGRLTSAVEPATGVTVEFLWDDADRLETTSGPDGTRRIERDADGWVTATVDPDGVRTVFQRDATGRVVGAEPDAVPSGRIAELADAEAATTTAGATVPAVSRSGATARCTATTTSVDSPRSRRPTAPRPGTRTARTGCWSPRPAPTAGGRTATTVPGVSSRSTTVPVPPPSTTTTTAAAAGRRGPTPAASSIAGTSSTVWSASTATTASTTSSAASTSATTRSGGPISSMTTSSATTR